MPLFMDVGEHGADLKACFVDADYIFEFETDEVDEWCILVVPFCKGKLKQCFLYASKTNYIMNTRANILTIIN